MKDFYSKTECVFCGYYREHGFSTYLCNRDSSDLSSAINKFNSCCPCNDFISSDIVKELQDCGDIYTSYLRFVRIDHKE